MSFAPYLHFQGNCADAMRFYADVFGAGDLMMMRYSEAPPDAGMPAGSGDGGGGDGVMHASLTAGGQYLMASDFPPGMAGEPQAAVSVTHTTDDVAKARIIFDRLVEGGTEVMPFGPTFWSHGFGMLKDRFGTHWMVMGPDKPMG